MPEGATVYTVCDSLVQGIQKGCVIGMCKRNAVEATKAKPAPSGGPLQLRVPSKPTVSCHFGIECDAFTPDLHIYADR